MKTKRPLIGKHVTRSVVLVVTPPEKRPQILYFIVSLKSLRPTGKLALLMTTSKLVRFSTGCQD